MEDNSFNRSALTVIPIVLNLSETRQEAPSSTISVANLLEDGGSRPVSSEASSRPKSASESLVSDNISQHSSSQSDLGSHTKPGAELSSGPTGTLGFAAAAQGSDVDVTRQTGVAGSGKALDEQDGQGLPKFVLAAGKYMTGKRKELSQHPPGTQCPECAPYKCSPECSWARQMVKSEANLPFKPAPSKMRLVALWCTITVLLAAGVMATLYFSGAFDAKLREPPEVQGGHLLSSLCRV